VVYAAINEIQVLAGSLDSTLDEDYWTALKILADEVGSIKECTAQGIP
jgi:hypothetical protein